MLEEELGKQWRGKLADFDPTPLAAASIGQVHSAVLPSGQPVAIKIQVFTLQMYFLKQKYTCNEFFGGFVYITAQCISVYIGQLLHKCVRYCPSREGHTMYIFVPVSWSGSEY